MNQTTETSSKQRGESMPSRMRRILEEARPNWKFISPKTAFTSMTFNRVKESDLKDLPEDVMKTIEEAFNEAKEADFENVDYDKIFSPIEDEKLRAKVVSRMPGRRPTTEAKAA